MVPRIWPIPRGCARGESPQGTRWSKKAPNRRESRLGKSKRLDSASIARLNESIRGYNHDDGTVQAVLGENGLPADSGIRDAVTLNRIDDWKGFHDAVLK